MTVQETNVELRNREAHALASKLAWGEIKIGYPVNDFPPVDLPIPRQKTETDSNQAKAEEVKK